MVMNKLELKKNKTATDSLLHGCESPFNKFSKSCKHVWVLLQILPRATLSYVSLVLQLCMDIVVKFDLYDQIYGCNSQTGNITFGI